MSSAEWEKCSFMLFLDSVWNYAIERFICFLGFPGSTLAENSWQWHIWRGFFKVTAVFWVGALHAFHSFPLKHPSTNDREDGWPLTNGATEVSSCLSPPFVNQHITTNPDTTWRNLISGVASQQPQQTRTKQEPWSCFSIKQNKHVGVHFVFCYTFNYQLFIKLNKVNNLV